MPQYRKPPPPTRATVRASVSVTRTGDAQARAPIRPPQAEIEQPIYHPEVEEPPPDYPESPDYETPDEEAAASDVVTIGEEQLARSAEIEAMGVENWKAAHDERRPSEEQRSVQGVGSLEQ